VLKGLGKRTLSEGSDPVSSTHEAITNPRHPNTVTTFGPELNRNIVMVNYYMDVELANYQTGVVVGDHAVLTAAHGFLTEPHGLGPAREWTKVRSAGRLWHYDKREFSVWKEAL